MEEEEGDIYSGVRAQFPLSFGKQSKSQTPLEAIHNATRRNNSNNPNPKPLKTNLNLNSNGKEKHLPSLSSSSKEWLSSLRSSKNPTPPPPPHPDDVIVGPPPPPPPGSHDDDDREMIGPPPPPPASNLSSDEDSDQDEVGKRFRIPLTNEIVLKGHTKVSLSLSLYDIIFIHQYYIYIYCKYYTFFFNYYLRSLKRVHS